MRCGFRALISWYLALLLFGLRMAETQGTPRVLVYSATAGYRHASIPTAIQTFKDQGSSYNIAFDFTEDETWFNDTGLAVYDCILFLSNSDEVLDAPGKTAFNNYLQKGGNFVGVHSASACLFTTEFFGQEIGAWFDYHPALCNATIVVLDPTHPSTAMLPERWPVQDEMYNFKSDPRSVGAKVILTVDESTYVDNGTRTYNQGTPHPIAWYQDQGAAYNGTGQGGRSWYTSLGHLSETWENDTYIAHVMEGLKWALESNTTRAFNPNGLVGNGTASTANSTASSTTGATATSSGTAPATSSISSKSAAGSVGQAALSGAALTAAAVGISFLA